MTKVHPCAIEVHSIEAPEDDLLIVTTTSATYNHLKENALLVEGSDVDDEAQQLAPPTGNSLQQSHVEDKPSRRTILNMSSMDVSNPSPPISRKGSLVKNRIHTMVNNFTSRTRRMKEAITQPPTPSSAGSDGSASSISMRFVARRRFESLVTKNSSVQGERSRASEVDVPEAPADSRWRPLSGCGKSIRRFATCHLTSSIDPQSKLYVLWLALVSCCYVYNTWTIALRTCFPYQTPETLHLWLLADYMADIVYVMDILLWKPRIKLLQDGFWISDPKETAKLYFKSSNFALDILSLLPMDLLYFYFGVHAVFRLPRYLKIRTFWEFFERFDRITSAPYIIRIIHTVLYMLFLIHVIACAYYAYSDYEGIGRPDNVWVYNGEGNAYIRCFLFATKIAASIGKNPSPQHETEYLFMTVSWLSGVFIFAMLIGQIRDILSVAATNEREYQKVIDRTAVYMNRQNLLDDLKDRVRTWFSYTWEHQKSLDENRALHRLPKKLRMDIAMHVHYHVLSKVKLFHDFDRNLLRELVLKLKPNLYLPGDYICKKGDVGKEMYIINYGYAEVLGGDNKVVATLSEGSVFGEVSLMSLGCGNRRTADVRSRGYSYLFVLSKSDLHSTLIDYPAARNKLLRRARRMMNAAAKNAPSAPSTQNLPNVDEVIPITRPNTPLFVRAVIKLLPPRSLLASRLQGSSPVPPAETSTTSGTSHPFAPEVIISTSTPRSMSDLGEETKL